MTGPTARGAGGFPAGPTTDSRTQKLLRRLAPWLCARG